MNFFWSRIIHPILNLIHPNTMVEIGCAHGFHTMQLLSFAQSHSSKLIAVDPAPQFDTRLVQAVYPNCFELKQDYSLQVLPQLQEVDLVLIDGDHNWYTVYHELKLLEQYKRFPIVMLHDTEWPYGRRDMYYFPDTIPIEYRQPHAKKGLLPGITELVEHGHNSDVDNALFEYGPRNGVLTAIEDFMQETQQPLTFMRVHSEHGLGIIIPNDSVQLPDINNKIQQILAASGL